MEEYLIYVLKSNVLAAACILLILLLARALKKKFSARWRYLAWLLTAVFLILPMHLFQGSPVIEIQVAPPPETVRTEAAAPGEAGESGAVPEQTQERRESAGYSDGTPGAVPAEQGNASAAEPASGSGVPLPPDSRVSGNAGFQLSAGPVLHILGILWAVGLVFWSVYRILTFRLFRSRIKENSYPVSDKKVRMLFRAVCRELGIKKPPALLYWEETDSPLMAGLLKPCLLLPQVWYGEGELRLIFLHELYHYKYRDLWYKTFLLAVGTLYWFNPLLWVMQRAADADLEYLCDSRVVKGMEREERMQYQRLLLKTAVSRSGQPAAGLRDSKESLKERILYMFRAGTLRSGFLLAVLLAGALAGGEAGTEESAWCPAARPFCSVLYSYMSTEMTPEEAADPYSWKHGYPEGLHSYLFRTVDGNTLSTVSGKDFRFSVPAYFDEYVTFMEDSENRGSLRALFSETGHSVFFVGHTGGNYEEFSHGFTGGWPGASGGMTLLWRGEGDDLVRSVGGDGLAAINYETAEAAVENPLDSLHIMYTIFDDSDVLLYTFAYTGTGEGTQYPQYP